VIDVAIFSPAAHSVWWMIDHRGLGAVWHVEVPGWTLIVPPIHTVLTTTAQQSGGREPECLLQYDTVVSHLCCLPHGDATVGSSPNLGAKAQDLCSLLS
jgi:hypothetical protein